jgi:hypothetical protein
VPALSGARRGRPHRPCPPCAPPWRRWGRSRAVNGRSTSDNHGQPWASSVQLSGPFWPSMAGHGHQPIRSDTEEDTGSGLDRACRTAGRSGPWSRRTGAPEASATGRDRNPRCSRDCSRDGPRHPGMSGYRMGRRCDIRPAQRPGRGQKRTSQHTA